MYELAGGIVLGGALGANDAANVFGTAVASHMVRLRRAVAITAVLVVAGAVLGGAPGIRTLGGMTDQTAWSAMVVSVVAGLTVLGMTALRLPVSTSQAVVGAILGMGLYIDPAGVRWAALGKVVACWVGTPVGAAVFAATAFPTLGWALDRLRLNIVWRSIVLRSSLLAAGAYGAYALGANNVANVTGVFYGTGVLDGLHGRQYLLALVGGLAIAGGVVAFGKAVMFTVGRDLVKLGAFAALVAVLAEAVTVHVYSFVGVPVSTSQAVVGAVLGIGLSRGARTVHARVLLRIVAGWLATPAVAGAICYAAAAVL